ncbi:hypothetical protein PPL_05415 [Heterostelium album PN500]|uniref:Uncharacterized protein n=1 Tax=Heterostelium pallidum (strain ATCC 26659 / Pp 5 / PN500) TaxID=670386 RepID=D3BA41_HETP5|nr:hypothetical protein PPL_05415 [Heterostelium album PN500]EFA81428.1 hypothetical protein PPL_05415 [Heterostelium album PN500]|eukprot:XP_020433546.1 hypothetical protein PPL_05415 [Heterostelium album PN500]
MDHHDLIYLSKKIEYIINKKVDPLVLGQSSIQDKCIGIEFQLRNLCDNCNKERTNLEEQIRNSNLEIISLKEKMDFLVSGQVAIKAEIKELEKQLQIGKVKLSKLVEEINDSPIKRVEEMLLKKYNKLKENQSKANSKTTYIHSKDESNTSLDNILIPTKFGLRI